MPQCLQGYNKVRCPLFQNFFVIVLNVPLQTKKYGETYWHRTHQIFGVKVCPIHSVKLIESSITITERNYKTYRLMDSDINEHSEFEK